MKQLKALLFGLLVMSICSSYDLRETGKQSNSRASHRAPKPNTVLLVYIGQLTGSMSISLGIHFEMDSSIGFRYEVTMERGNSVFSHTAIFYKFSSPKQTIIYNFLTHHSSVNTGNNSSSGDPKLTVVGTESIDSFTCTHLQHTGGDNDNKSVSDYWMSPQIPGFSTLANAVNAISPGLFSMGINGTIFNWGGLVKLNMIENSSSGPSAAMSLHLQEANRDLSFPASDFDVPAK